MTDPNLVDFWRGGWLTIVRHADHDGAIRLLRFGPVPEKKRDKVPGVLRYVNLYSGPGKLLLLLLNTWHTPNAGLCSVLIP